MNIKYSFALMALGVLTACNNNENPYDASGVFESTEVIVPARATGEIKQLTVEEGQTVEAGVLLGQIDATQLTLKKSQLSATKQSAESRRMDISTQVASIDQQIKNQQRELARFKALLKDGAATQKQVDDIQYQIAVLQRQKAAAQEQVKTSNESITGQSASYKEQMAQVDDQLSQTSIASPISGTVLAKYVEPGEWATPGKPLFKVSDIKRMKLRAYITADQLTTVKMGQKVKVYADQGKADRKEYQGTVVWISDKAEFTPKTIQTRDERANLVYAIKVAVDNDGLIKRGMYGDISF